MSSTVSTGLNLAQQEAVNHMHGPCLVLAGAGSGKTRVITHKIARLIQAGMDARRIAAITFTNKAAAEMRERAKGLVGRAAKDVLICTFHALGVRMLRQDGAALGLMAHCHCRAVAASVLPPQSFRMLVMSSVSRIEKLALSPSSWPSWRSMRTPSA